MNTLEQPSAEPAEDQHESLQETLIDSTAEQDQSEITGFDGGTRSIFSEPSLYLSIVVMFAVSLVSLGNTPLMFWISFLGTSVLAIAFHVVAERFIFKSKKEHHGMRAPFEGMFVVTLGAILPGLGLLAYGIHTLSTSVQPDSLLEEIAKLGLLVIVPIFNLAVWSAVRNGYLTRPRLVGLMNGLAVGLSASWTAIWIKSLILPEGAICKFGWMLLLCASPFMLFAGVCLSLDLWRKTESRIRAITTTFSIIGAMLSFLFVFVPMIRCFSLQSLLGDARQHTGAQRIKAIKLVRSIATVDELMSSTRQVSGFALAEMLIPSPGLLQYSDADQDLYFQITGRPYDQSTADANSGSVDDGSIVGNKVAGLSLAKSQLTGTIHADTLSSSLDWVLSFHNSGHSDEEARAEIKVPEGTAVSRATLWVDGKPFDGAFAPTAKAEAAYRSVVSARRDPLLITMPSADRLLVQCYPVPAYGGDMKVRVGFKIPMNNGDHNCSMGLPMIVDANFAQPKRHRVGLVSHEPLAKNISGITARKVGDDYLFSGILKADQSNKLAAVTVATTPFTRCATPNCFSSHKQYIVQELREVKASAPKHLFVVVDASAGLKNDAAAIRDSLSTLPAHMQPAVCIVSEPSTPPPPGEAVTSKVEASLPPIRLRSLEEAKEMIKPALFVGGQDNEPVLREVLETAGEKPNSAVLWIHGAQPFQRDAAATAPLDLVHGVKLYDLQIEPGPISSGLREMLKLLTCLPVDHHSRVDQDLKVLVSTWQHPVTRVIVQRTVQKEQPQMPIIFDKDVSEQVTCLWARDEVARLLARDDKQSAEELAARYRLITPVTGAVVLDSAKEYKKFKLNPRQYIDGSARYANNAPTGIVGAPINPRYGQTSEVGMLADYGYDTARDISRLLTGASFCISLVVAGFFLRSRKSLTFSIFAKSGGLVGLVPVIVHLLGTFIINNYSGLGGGL